MRTRTARLLTVVILSAVAFGTATARADEAADRLDALQQQLDATLTSASEAVANLIYGDRTSASEKLSDALALAQALTDAASSGDTAAVLGKSSSAIQKGATGLAGALTKAKATVDDAKKKNKSAIIAVLRAVGYGSKIKKTMLKVETAGPLVLVEQASAKLQTKAGKIVAFKVHVIGGGAAQATVTNIGGSSGRIVHGAASLAGEALSVKTGSDGGAVKITVTAGGRSSAGFVFNLGPFVPDVTKPKAPASEKTVVKPIFDSAFLLISPAQQVAELA